MTHLDRSLLRSLAEWDGAVPISSLYLTVDGGRYPRRADYEIRLDDLLRRIRAQAEPLDRDARRSVEGDAAAMSDFVRDGFDRGQTRGIGLFSCHAADRWESVLLPRPVRDRAVVAPQVDVLPLEVVLETYRPTGVALVDSEKARLFVVELGRLEEVSGLSDDVPGRHDQGGWAQMRMQRHIEDHRQRHLKRVADALFELFRRREFEHLVLAGPAEAHRDLEPLLHDYLRRRVRASLVLPMSATTAEVLRGALEVEEAAEQERERATIERLARAVAVGDHGVAGVEPTLQALGEARVEELVVSIDLSVPGAACPACGRLVTRGRRCPACRSETVGVPDVVEAAVGAALRTGSRVETVLDDGLEPFGGVGALLRF